MVVERVLALVMVGGLLIVSWGSQASAETNAADFDAVCGRACQHLKEGRCHEAMTAVTSVEESVRANVEREPGRELQILMIKARAYWHQMDVQGLEWFLTQFEKEYADTSAASWVRRAAWYERMLGYRFAEDLPRATEAFEKYRELEEQSLFARDQAGGLDAVARDFDLHVRMPTEIADLYRYMGKTESASEKYRSALEYVTAHRENLKSLDESADQFIGLPVPPSKYRDEILPAAIRECEARSDDALGILGREVACEAQQAGWLLAVGRGCSQQRAIDSAQEHYRRALQALETHRDMIDSLAPDDEARYLALEKQITKNADACHAELARLNEDKR